MYKYTCKYCKEEFQNRNKNCKFCSHECYYIWRSENIKGENHPRWGKKGKLSVNWQGGISKEPYNFEFNNELKELIRHRDGYKCQKCNCPEIETLRKLLIHHADYDKQNSRPSNLISLCNKCNTQVNFNRSYWTSYFKKKIKETMSSNLQLHFKYDGKVDGKSKTMLCLDCKKEFITSIKYPRKFCSRDCYYGWIKKHPEKHYKWKGPISVECKVCKKIFEVIKTSNRQFCSPECSNEARKGKHFSPATEFKKGNIPLDPIRKGEHRGLATEFKKGVSRGHYML